MKKILLFSLLISLKTFGQTPKMEVIAGSTESVDGLRAILKNTNPNGLYPGSAIHAVNNSTSSLGFGIFASHAGSGSGIYSRSGSGTGITGFSQSNIGVYGLAYGNTAKGVSGYAENGYGTGVYGSSEAGTGVVGYALNFYGTVGIGGHFSNASPTGYALITGTGKVGIGIANPTAKVDIKGSSYLSHFYYDTSEDTYIRGGQNTSKVIINDIVGLGNVGIGTNNPQAKLHISQGNLRVDALAGSGNVQLYADNQGTVSAALPIAFSAKYNASSTTINNVTSLTFPFSTENYDEGGFYNNSTYEFSAPLNGIYHFDCAVTFGVVNSASGTSMCSLTILVDAASSAISTQDLKVGGSKTVNLSQDIKLNAGQKVKISVYQSSGNTITLLGFNNTFFNGRLVTRL